MFGSRLGASFSSLTLDAVKISLETEPEYCC